MFFFVGGRGNIFHEGGIMSLCLYVNDLWSFCLKPFSSSNLVLGGIE